MDRIELYCTAAPLHCLANTETAAKAGRVLLQYISSPCSHPVKYGRFLYITMIILNFKLNSDFIRNYLEKSKTP